MLETIVTTPQNLMIGDYLVEAPGFARTVSRIVGLNEHRRTKTYQENNGTVTHKSVYISVKTADGIERWYVWGEAVVIQREENKTAWADELPKD